MDRVVIVFVKYPTPGEVKTRLARAVGENEATLFYKDCAEHTVRIACRCVHLQSRRSPRKAYAQVVL